MIRDVFISYWGGEDARRREIQSALNSRGFSTWSDRQVGEGEGALKDRPVPPGARFRETISAAIDGCATFLVLDSTGWRGSQLCREEMERARVRGKRVVVAGGGAAGRLPASAIVSGDDLDLLDQALATGLDLSRTQARLVIGAEATLRNKENDDEPSRKELRAYERADPRGSGIYLDEPTERYLAILAERHRARTARVHKAVSAALLILALLTAVAVVAWISARSDENAAQASLAHVRSLDLASRSAEAGSSYASLALSRRAVELDPGVEAIAALRASMGGLSKGVEVGATQLQDPDVAAVSNDGTVAALANSSGAVVIVGMGGSISEQMVPAAAAEVGATLTFAPDGRTLLAVRRDDGAVERIDARTAHVTVVAGTENIVSTFFLDEHRALAVGRGGVIEFNPSEAKPRGHLLTRIGGPIRAASLAGGGGSRTPRLAMIGDGDIEVVDLSRPSTPWRVPIGVGQVGYRPGDEQVAVCGDKLAAFVTDGRLVKLPIQIPYTVDESGGVRKTGSLIHSFGLICLPDGHAIAADYESGQHPFPADGPTLPALAEAQSNSAFAIASSENDRWAVVAAEDGSLTVVQLPSYGRSWAEPDLSAVLPAEAGVLTVGGTGIGWFHDGRVVPLRGVPDAGSAGRGAFVLPGHGTVLPLADALYLADNGDTRLLARTSEPIEVVGEGPAETILALGEGGGSVTEISADRSDGTPRYIPVPPDLRVGGDPDWVARGRGDTVVVAATNGRVDLLAGGSGRELRHVILPPGPIDVAWAGGAGVLAAASDGSLYLLDPETLEIVRRVKLLEAGPDQVVSDYRRRIAVAFSQHAASVVSLPGLAVIARPPAPEGLASASFESGGRRLTMVGAIAYPDGTEDSELSSWPLCQECASGPQHLEEAAGQLLKRKGRWREPDFHPTHMFRETR
jgi:hypothetical protein